MAGWSLSGITFTEIMMTPACRSVRRSKPARSCGEKSIAARDRAILRLSFDLGLRRGELASLDLEHLDLEAGTLAVLGKGQEERELLSLPSETTAAKAQNGGVGEPRQSLEVWPVRR